LKEKNGNDIYSIWVVNDYTDVNIEIFWRMSLQKILEHFTRIN